MVETLIELFTQHIPHQLTVLVVSMFPMVGLHGGFLAATLLDIPWNQAIILTVVGNILPVPFILLFVRAVLGFMMTTRALSGIARFFEDKALRKISALAQKYPQHVLIGLFVFVVVPLPGSGSWTGSLVAAVMRLPIRQSLPVIALGTVVACLLMLLLAYVFPAAMGF